MAGYSITAPAAGLAAGQQTTGANLMAVFTVLDRDEIAALIEPFGLGPLVDYQGIAAGIENTNYFVTTDQSGFPSELHTQPLQHFVLTIFEHLKTQELGFFIKLTSLLNLRGLPVPAPLTDSDGKATILVQAKPALITPKIDGSHPDRPSARLCRDAGHFLASMHQTCLQAGLSHPHEKGLNWMQATAHQLQPELSASDQKLLAELPRFMALANEHSADLPTGIIHSDLFRDNVLCQNERLNGVIDFYSAGTGYLAFDLAITVNDWCSNPDGRLNQDLCQSLLSAYQQVRRLTPSEQALWGDFLRVAALRYWLSRQLAQFYAAHANAPGELIDLKDPDEYRQILLDRIKQKYLCP